MLELNPALLIGKGRDRACYQHPDNEDLCIKVALRSEKQTRREIAYFRFLQRHNKDLSHLALFRGMENTNLGPGAAFDLIRNDDGQVSMTLRQAIEARQISEPELTALIAELRDYLYSEVICVRDLSPNNLMLQIGAERQTLMIIDGVSNPGVNPLNLRWRWLAHRFLDKSWNSLQRKLEALPTLAHGTAESA